MSKLWRISLGESGCRVVLFERKPGGNLYREVYLGGKRVAAQKSLGHRDKERAKADAYKLLATLKTHEEALSGGKLTLQTLFDNYIGSPAFNAKKERTQREDQRRLERLLWFLGPERDVASLSPSDMQRYTEARSHGQYGPTGKPVRPRTIAADLVALSTMLNWATRERTSQGKPLLQYNPLRGVKLPVEKNPRRPVATWERFEKTRLAMQQLQRSESEAERQRWTKMELALVLVEATGRRLGSVRQLRWEDVDLGEQPTIRWRAEADKKGYEAVVPMSAELANELRNFRRSLGAVAGWVFARKSDRSEPMDRHLFNKWLVVAEKEAGLPKLKGALWHAYRRKWATERKHHPLKDVAEAGGWRDTEALLTCYQRPDSETLLAVVSELRKVREGGVR